MATKLGVSTFKATCCGQSFEGEAGATALLAHAKGGHRGQGRVIRPGSIHGMGDAPGWKNGKIEKPYPWKAPRPTLGGLDHVIRQIEDGAYDVYYPYSQTDGVKPFHVTAEGGYESPCGELYSTEDDMRSHELTCGACAGAVEQAS